MESTSPDRPLKAKIRTAALGVLATAALSLPAVSTLAVTTHDAGRAPAKFGTVSPDSHRIAISLKPASVRLT
jgi:hypothetical protein